MFRAAHGIGKSELVNSLNNDIATYLYPNEKDRIKAYGTKEYVYPMIMRRGSQLPDSGELSGLPFADEDGKTTSFRPMKWMYRAFTEPCILFFDEVDRSPTD